MAVADAPVAPVQLRRLGMAVTKRLTAEALAEALMQPAPATPSGSSSCCETRADPCQRASAMPAATISASNSSATACSALSSPTCCSRHFPTPPKAKLSLRASTHWSMRETLLRDRRWRCGLPDLIRAEPPEVRGLDAARARQLCCADAVEALIAAIYLDGGLEAARAFVLRYWEPRSLARSVAKLVAMPKPNCRNGSHQAAAGAMPAYAIESREGPDHRSAVHGQRQGRPALRRPSAVAAPSERPSRRRPRISYARRRLGRIGAKIGIDFWRARCVDLKSQSVLCASKRTCGALMKGARHDRHRRPRSGNRRSRHAFRLRRADRRAQCRQVDAGQPAGRRQGVDRHPQGADHPRHRARHRHA